MYNVLRLPDEVFHLLDNERQVQNLAVLAAQRIFRQTKLSM